MLVVAFLIALPLAIPPVPTEDAAAEFAVALERMARVERELRDVACVFHRREYVDGALRAAQTITLKWRRAGGVYMKWTAGPDEGQEVLWRAGWEDMKVATGIMTLHIGPSSWLARQGERHTVHDAGPGYMARLILHDARRTQARVARLPSRRVHGAPARCFATEQAKESMPDLYAARAEICIDDATGLPSIVRVWNVEDGALRLVEDYAFEALRVNAGLDDVELSPDNPAYRF